MSPAEAAFDCTRRYLEDTMVLCTRFDTETGSVKVLDFMVLTDENSTYPDRQLIRLVEGLEGQVALDVYVEPRFGFGDIKPWLRQHDPDVFVAVGGENGLAIVAIWT